MQGINANGAWKNSKLVRDFMCGVMYGFFNENTISEKNLETFLKMEYKMERGAADMAHSVVNSLLEGKGAGKGVSPASVYRLYRER